MPLVLAAIVFMQLFADQRTVFMVVVVLAVFGWPPIARITRGAVMEAKNEEYVTAARALGASRWRIITAHILPNAAAPIIVYATVAFGTFIVAEATLSFLGLDFPPMWFRGAVTFPRPDGSPYRANGAVLPALALAMTVLSFS